MQLVEKVVLRWPRSLSQGGGANSCSELLQSTFSSVFAAKSDTLSLWDVFRRDYDINHNSLIRPKHDTTCLSMIN